MINTFGQWFRREWHGHEINFLLLGLIFLAVLPTFVEMFVEFVGWLGHRFPKVFLCLLAAGSAALLKYLGAPAYVIVLSFAAALGWWTLYQEVLRTQEEAVKSREEAVRSREEAVKSQEAVRSQEAAVRSLEEAMMRQEEAMKSQEEAICLGKRR
jgi:membrane protein implicated in regulation of membrane protease activity